KRIVLGIDEIQPRGRVPLAQPHARPAVPSEWPRWLGLALSVHYHRVVCGRAAEEVAPLGLGRVAVVAGVDQTGFAEYCALDAQEIGMPVSGADRAAERTDVDDHLVGGAIPCITQYRVTACREHTRR